MKKQPKYLWVHPGKFTNNTIGDNCYYYGTLKQYQNELKEYLHPKEIEEYIKKSKRFKKV